MAKRKPRLGRPPLPPGQALSRPVVIKVSETKHGTWSTAAALRGQTLGEWIREAADARAEAELTAARGGAR